ncbi:ketopantoate reductase PanE/ApbA C terminal-domain-containing protein [Lophiotrema nucula]|uniref:Ketopantoate reductase PanE/ApbA C terminal-domain-containing protein n=1 Tax=Lophiotrema nucula TaxID=690887 RepID=A0A6A5YR89_9PLEO|nr:ketopantoate reductase PanE/ApbA C terminal-domain-containing protein [Lophiotrema nucula]
MERWLKHGNLDPQGREEKSANEETQDSTAARSKSALNAKTVAEFYRTQPVRDRRIHVLGMNNTARFIAHSLRGIPNPPPITLILHSWDLINQWKASAQKLQLITDGMAEKREGYEVELALPRARFHGKEIRHEGNAAEISEQEGKGGRRDMGRSLEGESEEPIHSLILCTKTPFLLQALSSVKHRLHPESVVLFLQNGMGTVEEVNKEIFPDPATRPHYMLGINTHRIQSAPDDPFTAIHANFGTLSLGLLPPERLREPAPYAPSPKFLGKVDKRDPVEAKYPATPHPDEAPSTNQMVPWTPNDRYLLRTLLRTPVLVATAFSPSDLLQMQLEKLAVNCIINPLTVMLDARNGAILYNYSMTRVFRLLLSEISLVIRNLPELQYIPNVSHRFDPGRLESLVVGYAHHTRDNISSMLNDVRLGRKTEVEYFNGWIVKRGEEQGVRCLMNYMLMNMVKGKGMMVQLEVGEGIPFVEGKMDEGGVEIKGQSGVEE